MKIKIKITPHKFVNEIYSHTDDYKIYYTCEYFRQEKDRLIKVDEFSTDMFSEIYFQCIEKKWFERKFRDKFESDHLLSDKYEFETELLPIKNKLLLFSVINAREYIQNNKIYYDWNIDVFDQELTISSRKIVSINLQPVKKFDNLTLNDNLKFQIKKEYLKTKNKSEVIEDTDVDENDFDIEFDLRYTYIEKSFVVNKSYIKNNKENNSLPEKVSLISIGYEIGIKNPEENVSSLIVSTDEGLKLIDKYTFSINYEILN